MKTKYQMMKEMLKSGVSKQQIRTKDFSFHVFKLNFSNWNFSLFSFADASFVDASFDRASFDRASFDRASFDRASFVDASFVAASFVDASFDSASFVDASFNETTSFLFIACPEQGSFVGWKKARGQIVKLQITENAKRSSATTLKCRCSEAFVLSIENIDGSDSGLTEIQSNYDSSFVYKVGEIVSVQNFDKNRWNECSTGIHFFINRKIAECYN